MTNTKIAILITCYNRRETTLRCLKALYQQELAFDVYLTDDGSTDGTSEVINTHYPEVKILQGNGSLFWGGGTRLAFGEAVKANYDCYVWLNDDTILKPHALNTLLDTHHHLTQQGKPDSIIVGSIQDPITGKLTYGGRVRANFWSPLKFKTVEPSEYPKECETMNGNCVLIPQVVVEKIGNIDPTFTHIRGDVDYGLRARQQGVSVCVAPGYLGTCNRNSLDKTWKDTSQPLPERLKKVNHPKGLPLNESRIYAKRHGGTFWFFYWLSPYLKGIILPLLIPSLSKK